MRPKRNHMTLEIEHACVRDPRNGFHTPYSPNWRNSKDVIFKPAWALDMMRNGLPSA